MYVSLLPVVEACVVVAVPGRVGEPRAGTGSRSTWGFGFFTEGSHLEVS